MARLPILPADRKVVNPDTGELTDAYWLFFDSVARSMRNGSAFDGYYVITVDGSNRATPDLSQGRNQEVDLDRATTAIQPPNSPPAVTWTLIIVQDATGGRAVTFDATYLGASTLALSTDPDTYSSLDWTVRPDGTQALSNLVTGVPVT
jgi:hypothetical protein